MPSKNGMKKFKGYVSRTKESVAKKWRERQAEKKALQTVYKTELKKYKKEADKKDFAAKVAKMRKKAREKVTMTKAERIQSDLGKLKKFKKKIDKYAPKKRAGSDDPMGMGFGISGGGGMDDMFGGGKRRKRSKRPMDWL